MLLRELFILLLLLLSVDVLIAKLLVFRSVGMSKVFDQHLT